MQVLVLYCIVVFRGGIRCGGGGGGGNDRG